MEKQRRSPPLILASASPRRSRILSQIGIPHEVRPSHTNEDHDGTASPLMLARHLAERKLQSYLETARSSERKSPWVLTADTLIDIEGQIIGKPDNREEARKMIRSFSGNSHEVITALCLHNTESEATYRDEAITKVVFAAMNSEEVEWYLDTEEWKGVAGAYRIQNRGACFISSIHGSYSNVMGLPIHTFYGIVRQSGYAMSCSDQEHQPKTPPLG
ncbi:MAG: Maf family protein [Spirochaetales bacterium]|nr:Maf family protein [Spirochaetales bacterium]MCF7937474.1 Maf family protein [Spirochaetales bacterium]